MRTSVARLISIVGHPFALLSLLVFVVQNYRDSQGAVRITLVFTMLVLVPLGLLIWRSRASGRWGTVDASDKADRPALYATVGRVLFGVGAYFHFVEGSAVLVRGCVVVGSMMLVAFALNHWIKLSLHVAFASFCGLLLTRVQIGAGLLTLLLVPPLIWSRLVLSRHFLSETIGGLVLGCAGASVLIRT